MSNEMMIPDVALRANRSERLACVLVVDGSGSMAASGAIEYLQEGLSLLERELKGNDDTAYGVQISIIRMGDDDQVVELTPFVDAANFTAPIVTASGRTPLGKAVDYAMRMIEEQKQRYRQNEITYKRPWLWIMSDGAPTDAWEAVAERAREAQQKKQFTLWAIGIGRDAPLEVLKAFAKDGQNCFRLGEKDLKVMFEFLSASAAVASQAAAGQQIALPAHSTKMIEV